MDLSKLTLQELRESRDDLVKTILTEADEGKRIKALEDEKKILQETIDGYKTKEAQHALQEAIAGELKAAGLDPANKTHCSEVFVEDLHATADPVKRKAKIDDRKGLLGAARYELETDYLMFMPPGLAFLGPIDRALAWLPLGAQYAVAARKPV